MHTKYRKVAGKYGLAVLLGVLAIILFLLFGGYLTE
jgi:hypothetical protein